MLRTIGIDQSEVLSLDMLTEEPGIPRGWVVEGSRRHHLKWVRGPLERLILKRPELTKDAPQGCL